MKIYALLLFLSGIVPLALSFDKELQFYKRWKIVFPVLLIVATVYLVPDIFLTQKGIWGFNSHYLFQTKILGLPLEEILFFIVVPYACIFIHEAFFHYFPNRHLGPRASTTITSLLIVFFIFLLVRHMNQIYTFYAALLMTVTLVIGLFDRGRVIDRLYVSFLIMLLPFLIMDGILTGSLLREPIVWYNPSAILGLRIFSIPIEDLAYGFSLVFFDLFLIEQFSARNNKIKVRR